MPDGGDDNARVEGSAQMSVGTGAPVTGRLSLGADGLTFEAGGEVLAALPVSRVLDLEEVDDGAAVRVTHQGVLLRFAGEVMPRLRATLANVREAMQVQLEAADPSVGRWPATWLLDTGGRTGALVISTEWIRFEVSGPTPPEPAPSLSLAAITSASVDADRRLGLVAGKHRVWLQTADPVARLRDIAGRLLQTESAAGPPSLPGGEIDPAAAKAHFGRWLDPSGEVLLCCAAIRVEESRVRRGWIGLSTKEAFFVPAKVLVAQDVRKVATGQLTAPPPSSRQSGRLQFAGVKAVLRAGEDFVPRFWRQHGALLSAAAPIADSQPPDGGANRRRTYRVPVRDEVRVSILVPTGEGGPPERVAASVLDVSLEGCGIELGSGDEYAVESKRALGTAAAVEVEFEFEGEIFRAVGKVVFSAKHARTGLWRHGIHLATLPPRVSDRVRSMVMELQRRALARVAKTDL